MRWEREVARNCGKNGTFQFIIPAVHLQSKVINNILYYSSLNVHEDRRQILLRGQVKGDFFLKGGGGRWGALTNPFEISSPSPENQMGLRTVGRHTYAIWLKMNAFHDRRKSAFLNLLNLTKLLSRALLTRHCQTMLLF